MEPDCPGFSMKWDALPSRPVPIFGTKDVPRCPDQNARMMVNNPITTHGMVSHPGVP